MIGLLCNPRFKPSFHNRNITTPPAAPGLSNNLAL